MIHSILEKHRGRGQKEKKKGHAMVWPNQSNRSLHCMEIWNGQ